MSINKKLMNIWRSLEGNNDRRSIWRSIKKHNKKSNEIGESVSTIQKQVSERVGKIYAPRTDKYITIKK